MSRMRKFTADELDALILEGLRESGAPLSVGEVCDMVGLSTRPAVRSALESLTSDGRIVSLEVRRKAGFSGQYRAVRVFGPNGGPDAARG
jgi:DNA-binding GntR family transcriptional regulator